MIDTEKADRLIAGWRAQVDAQYEADMAKHREQMRVAKEKLRVDGREVVFRFLHPIKAIQTWWKHKPAHGSLLHPLYEADQASGVKA